MTDDLTTSEPKTKPGKDTTLPIVAISGRWGKTTTARLLEAMLLRQHTRLALWIDQGVWTGGRKQRGELIPWGKALQALAQGELDLAIQELDSRTLVAAGLPPAAYSLGIITSFCGNDQFCEAEGRSKIERQAQAMLSRAIKPNGTLILNADDHTVVASGRRGASASIIYYSLSRSNPIVRAHRAAGHRAVTISSGMIVVCEGQYSWPVVAVREVALAVGGAIVFQVQNALAAIAGAWQLNVPIAQIAATLCMFTSSPSLLPGSCNQFMIQGAVVLLDTFHDMVSLRGIIRGLRKVPNRHRQIIVLSDAQLTLVNTSEVGRLIRQVFKLVILHHDTITATEELAKPSPVTKSLLTSIARTALPPIVHGVSQESVALTYLLQQLKPNDLALVLAVDQTIALRTLMTHRDTPTLAFG